MQIIVIFNERTKIVQLFTTKSLAAKFIGANRKTIERGIKTGKAVKDEWLCYEQELVKMRARNKGNLIK